MFLKFHLTYKDKNGQTVTDIKSIVLHYVKDPMGFTFDLVAILPYEILAAPIPDASIRTSAVLYLRLPHVIRGVRIQFFLSEEEKKLNQRYCITILSSCNTLILSPQDTTTTYYQIHSTHISVYSLCGMFMVYPWLPGQHLSQWYLGQYSQSS